MSYKIDDLIKEIPASTESTRAFFYPRIEKLIRSAVGEMEETKFLSKYKSPGVEVLVDIEMIKNDLRKEILSNAGLEIK